MIPDFSSVSMPLISCQSRPFEASAIKWEKRVVEFERDGIRLRFRPIDRADIPTMVGLYREHCPYFYRSGRHELLDEPFYFNQVALLSNWEEDAARKLYFGGVGENIDTGEIAIAFLCRRDPYDRVSQNLPVIIDPRYRGKDLATDYMSYLDMVWQESGFDYVYGFVTAQHTLSQRAILNVQGHTGGILPGITRRSQHKTQYYRDAQAYVYKFYNQAESYSTQPEDWNLDDEARMQLMAWTQAAPAPTRELPPLKPLEETPFQWSQKIVEVERNGRRFRIRPIDVDDIPHVARLYFEYCPCLYRSSGSYLFDEQFYKENVCLLSQWEAHSRERMYCFSVVEDVATGEVIMPFGTARDPYDRMGKHIATVMKPEFRGYSLAADWMAYVDGLCSDSGFDYAYGLVSLQHTISQKISARLGYRAAAIFPGFIRRTYDGVRYYRDAQLYMYKFYNGADHYATRREAWQLDSRFLGDIQALIAKSTPQTHL